MSGYGEFVPINGQELCEYAELRFGWLRIATNGCGPIAIYNAMGLAGKTVDFLDVVAHLDRWYKPRFFGVSPREIGHYLLSLGVSCQRADSLEELRAMLKTGGVALLTKWNAKWPRLHKGAHTVTIFCDEGYTVYNRYSNRARTYACQSLEEIIGEGIFMRGYVIASQ